MPRPYPALSIELQHYLGAGGMAFDMNVACSSATFGIKTAADMLAAARRSWRWWSIRRSARGTSTLEIEIVTLSSVTPAPPYCWSGQKIARSRPLAAGGEALVTQYSNNIRNNFGFLNRFSPRTRYGDDKLFRQQGRKVFKEVLPLVCDQIAAQLEEQGWAADDLSRLWLHQANLTMNQFIGRKLLGHDASQQEAPVILDRYGNTSSAGLRSSPSTCSTRTCRAGPRCSAPSAPATPSAACCCNGANAQKSHPRVAFHVASTACSNGFDGQDQAFRFFI